MNRSTGWDPRCQVVVKLKSTAIAAGAIDAIARHGFKVRARKLRESVSAKIAATLSQSHLRSLLAGTKVLTARSLFAPHADDKSRLDSALNGIAAEGLSALFHEKIPRALQGHLMLSFSSPEEAAQALKRLVNDPLVERVHVPQPRYFCADELEGEQWGHALLGSLQNASSVTIAVIDSGVDESNPDLTGIVAPLNYQTGANTAEDADGHGTHCIGIIAARGGNGVGVRGVCRPRKVLSMRVGPPIDMHGYYEALAQAVSQGARVINLSLAGEHDPTEESILHDAVSQGVVVCAAVGNEGVPAKRYPAALSESIDGIIAVGAMTPERTRAGFSNIGSHVDLMAPGVNIMSTLPVHSQIGPPYGKLTGTSMSTPFVTGAAAVAIHKNPSLSPKEIRDLLRARATLLAGQTFRTDECGFGCVSVP